MNIIEAYGKVKVTTSSLNIRDNSVNRGIIGTFIYNDEVVYKLSRELLDKYGISIHDDALDLIVNIAVTLLLKTK